MASSAGTGTDEAPSGVDSLSEEQKSALREVLGQGSCLLTVPGVRTAPSGRGIGVHSCPALCLCRVMLPHIVLQA